MQLFGVKYKRKEVAIEVDRYRREGYTTREIDGLIQEFFKTGKVHFASTDESMLLRDRFYKRLDSEHYALMDKLKKHKVFNSKISTRVGLEIDMEKFKEMLTANNCEVIGFKKG
jgi:hypothetical protein